jgi:phosphatidylglycerophosphate synthase
VVARHHGWLVPAVDRNAVFQEQPIERSCFVTRNPFKTARDSYVAVRIQTPLYSIYDSTLVSWIFSARISPIFTAIFVKYGVRPNSITVLMILSGLFGAALFAVDNVYAKVAGYIFIQLWFVMDCSDGEVARITKDFSRFGTEMDYLAHLLTHPVFQISFLVSAIQLYAREGAQPIALMGIFSAIAIVELMIRGMLGLQLIQRQKELEQTPAVTPAPSKGRMIRNLFIGAIYIYPNVALLFPIVYFFDLYFNSKIGFYYAIVVLIVSVPMMLKLSLSNISKLGAYPTSRSSN